MVRGISIRAPPPPDKGNTKRPGREAFSRRPGARPLLCVKHGKNAGKTRTSGAGAFLSLDSARRRVYIFWIHFLLRSNLMAHKKIERAKELDRRRHRRAKRIKERIHEAKAAAKK